MNEVDSEKTPPNHSEEIESAIIHFLKNAEDENDLNKLLRTIKKQSLICGVLRWKLKTN